MEATTTHPSQDVKSWKQLPLELLELIFGTWDDLDDKPILHREYLYQCQLVCKKWNGLARDAFNRHIRLYNMDARRIVEKFVQGNPFTTNDSVKSMEFLFKDGINRTLAFQALAVLFPNLETISTDCALNSAFYRALIDIHRDPTMPACARQTEAVELVESVDIQLNSDYLECALVCRNTLEELLLIRIPDDAAQFNNISTFLHQFNHMKRLYIIKLAENTLTEFDIIEACPVLKELKINTIRPRAVRRGVLHPLQLADIDVRPSINVLKIDFIIFDNDELLYLMKKVSGVKSLVIGQYYDAAQHKNQLTINHSDFDLVPHFNITSDTVVTVLMYCRDLLKKPSSALIYISLSILYQAVQVYFAQHQLSNIHLYLGYNYTPGWSRSVDGSIGLFGLSSHKNYLGEKDKDPFVIEFVPPRDDHHLNQMQHMEAIEQIGTHVEKLSLTKLGISSSIHGGGTVDMQTVYFLDHLFQHCPNLVKLRLMKFTLRHCDPQLVCINHSITHFTLLDCSITNHILTKLSVRLPSLEYLKMYDCQLEDAYQDNNVSFQLIMPNTSLKRLFITKYITLPTYLKL